MGRPAKDLSGQKFGRLTVLHRHPLNKYGKPAWDCECRCGMRTTVAGIALRKGFTRSCGCLRSDTLRARKKTGEKAPITPSTESNHSGEQA